jgi:hypothetical protein
MQNLINQILNHKNLFHKSTTITKHHLNNNYLKKHLQSINNVENLQQILTMLDNIK